MRYNRNKSEEGWCVEMRFGVCVPISEAARMAKIGFDYIEVGASALAAMTDAEFETFCAQNEIAPIHAEAANVLFPGTVRLTGADVDWDEVAAYIEKVIERLGRARIAIAVFGSSGSRKVPEGFSMDRAWEQLVRVGRMLGEAAEKYGVIVALEPLRIAETNIINKQAEGLKLVKEVNHPHFKLLSDYYHLMQEGETPAEVEVCGDVLAHIHIANPCSRKAMYPGDGADYAAFFNALRNAGYDARISFEGGCDDYEAQLPSALEVMKQA